MKRAPTIGAGFFVLFREKYNEPTSVSLTNSEKQQKQTKLVKSVQATFLQPVST